MDLSAYYKMQDTLYTVTQDQLFALTLTIPITSTTTVYTVYREYKQRLFESAPNDTKPLSLSPRIRISLWAAVSCSISQCRSHNFNHVRVICSSVVTNVWLSKKLPRTWRVVWRYFEYRISHVEERCEFTLLLNDNGIDTQVLSLDTNTYLLSTFDLIWMQSCPDGRPVYF